MSNIYIYIWLKGNFMTVLVRCCELLVFWGVWICLITFVGLGVLRGTVGILWWEMNRIDERDFVEGVQIERSQEPLARSYLCLLHQPVEKDRSLQLAVLFAKPIHCRPFPRKSSVLGTGTPRPPNSWRLLQGLVNVPFWEYWTSPEIVAI